MTKFSSRQFKTSMMKMTVKVDGTFTVKFIHYMRELKLSKRKWSWTLTLSKTIPVLRFNNPPSTSLRNVLQAQHLKEMISVIVITVHTKVAQLKNVFPGHCYILLVRPTTRTYWLTLVKAPPKDIAIDFFYQSGFDHNEVNYGKWYSTINVSILSIIKKCLLFTMVIRLSRGTASQLACLRNFS